VELTLWTYEGPPHVGAMRVATGMSDVHYVLHAPQGDTYADLLFTMIERRDHRPPVTYTTFQARDLGSDTAELFQSAARDAYDRFKPGVMLVGASCTAELIQDDPGGLTQALALPIPVVPLELPAYQKKENWGASETLYRLVRTLLSNVDTSGRKDVDTSGRKDDADPDQAGAGATGAAGPTRRAATCNLLGATALGFRNRDDVTEITRLLERIGVHVNVCAPLYASADDIRRIPDADFNVVLYPEIARSTAEWLKRAFKQPFTTVVPIGVNATREFIAEVADLAGISPDMAASENDLRLPWYARSVDSTYLNGKRVFIFGDGTHAAAAARVAVEEFGFKLVGIGTYSREMAREVRAAAKAYDAEAVITDDYLEVEERIAQLRPELVLGTQMERHIAKRQGIGCAVISAPVHVQDFPARYAPQMGFEGANVLFDTWVHPLMMGLEEHLIHMFREDFEFNDSAPSHLSGHGASGHGAATAGATTAAPDADAAQPLATPHTAVGAIDPEDTTTATSDLSAADDGAIVWAGEAEKELKRIPFFVRGKARRNAEAFARDRGLALITLETLYDAKAHFGN